MQHAATKILMAGFFCAAAFAGDDANPILVLYQERYALSQIEIAKAKVDFDYLNTRTERLKHLFAHQAVAAVKFEDTARDRDIAALHLKALEIKARQAEAMVGIGNFQGRCRAVV